MFIQMHSEKFMRFPEGRTKALTFSYDDGTVSDKRLIEIFDRYALKGTFNLNSLLFSEECRDWHGRMDEDETYETFADAPHEIALHGARHIFLDRVSLPEAVNEIVQNRVWLENKFNRIVRGMAYPYRAYGGEIREAVKFAGAVYARTTDSTHSFALPGDWLELNPTCHHGDSRLFELADRFLSARPERELKERDPMLFYVWGHSYEFDDNENWDLIENFAKRMSGRKDIWYATNIQIYDYVRAYKSLVFSIDGERTFNPSALPVWIEIRGRVYRIDGGKTVIFEKP